MPDEVIAFDTGPGNMVIDALVCEYTKSKLKFDRNGRLAAPFPWRVSEQAAIWQ
jgi:anhydro-N-acetylmuramic acid kinase